MAKDGRYDKSVFQSLALVTQFGITMIVPIFLCSFLGWFLDEKLGTSYLFVLLFFIGALAGFRNIYILSKKVAETKTQRELEKAADYEEIRRNISKEKSKKHE